MTDSSAPAGDAAAGESAPPATGGIPTPGDLAAQQQAPTPPASTDGQPADKPADTDPAKELQRLQAENLRLRKEAGDQRINAKNAAREDGMRQAAIALAKAAGIELPSDDAEPPTVEKVSQQLSQVQAERNAAALRAATIEAAWQAGVDPTKLGYLSYALSQNPAYTGLDPAAPDFSANLQAAIDAQVSMDTTLKLTGSAVASGVERLGGASGSSTITPEAFAQMNITERSNLYKTDKATYDKLVGNAS